VKRARGEPRAGVPCWSGGVPALNLPGVMRLLAIPVVFLGLLAAAIVWSRGSAQHTPDFAYIDRGDIFTLDLNQVSYMQDFRVLYALREGLYCSDPDTLRPVLTGAKSKDVSPDGKVWTFHLRPEARWTNGDPVTAHDYVFSFRRMLEEPGEYTYLFDVFTGSKAYQEAYKKGEPADFKTVGIQAVDDLTLRLTLENPLTYLEELLAFPIFYPRNQRSMEPFKLEQPGGKFTYRADYTRPAKRAGGEGVVTNGPYELKVWEFKRRLVLEKSPTYWDRDNVKLERIEKVVNENALGQFLSYEAGEVQWLSDVNADLAAELLQKKRPDLRTSPAFGTMFMTLMMRPELPPSAGGGKNPLADVRVRQALAMSIDKQFIVDNITRIGELPARTYLPPDGTLPDFRWLPGPYDTGRKPGQPYTDVEIRDILKKPPQPDGPGLPYDIPKAKKLLADAGYPEGKGFPSLPIMFHSENAVRGKIAQALKNQWKAALNLDFTVQSLEGKMVKERVSRKDYVIATVTWFGDYPDISTFTDKYNSTSLQNDSDYIDKEYDQLLVDAAKEPDPAKRVTILSKAEHKLDTEVPIIPIYHYVNAYLSRDNVHHVEPNPRSIILFKWVYLDRAR
jgi:oligopeptide transport system substrate-binding protein